MALVLAYCGDAFLGWQVQPKGSTVQGALESCLTRLCNEPIRVAASGRTDAGVHAWGQVASFTTNSNLSLERMEKGLKAMLPPEVCLRGLGQVRPGFHARYDAKAKTYDYFIWPGKKGRLFLQNRVWDLDRDLNAGRIKEALAGLPGDRDLRAMASQGVEVKGSTVRRVLAAELAQEPGGPWRISLTATGFLRHVVRNLVGTLAQIGWGKLPPEALFDMLEAGNRFHPGPKAPAGGLYLNRVYYDHPLHLNTQVL
ncbi:tRNA pseudouridine synthase A [Dethiosulfatarculus sandiegensis]|uniref:tRNA pseudouridine synthase A n=1 Tax=Dethiosulfatarculus sandiegensis TaxID=1429043 RepID=A0A0D2J6X9_9BACT|nr:tRNA pseudouridine synthase A [Dethiosulfatarculus sandiegensis]